MPFGFYIIMAAQFFSSLADNALLVAAIALLLQMQTPEWMTPLLKFFFTVLYVVFAAFVGAFADSMPKGRVMFITNMVKIAGCLMMFFHQWLTLPGVAPYAVVLLAYSVVGLGAAAYSPAKYGILTEYLPHQKLVVANGWIEGLTVASIILGTLLGGVLVSQAVSSLLLEIDFPGIETGIDSAFGSRDRDDHDLLSDRRDLQPLHSQYRCRSSGAKPQSALSRAGVRALRDAPVARQARTGIACDDHAFLGRRARRSSSSCSSGPMWHSAIRSPRRRCSRASCAVGIAVGAVMAARFVPLRRAVDVVPVGIAMGVIVISMNFAKTVAVAIPLMILIGALAGFFVVPMNALLQHRGHILMGAGHSIAVQNFNENLSILVMLSTYAFLMWIDFSIYSVIVLFGLFVASTMVLVRRHHLRNVRAGGLPVIPSDAHH